MVGLHDDATTLGFHDVVRGQISIQGSYAYTASDYEQALEWLVDGRAGIGGLPPGPPPARGPGARPGAPRRARRAIMGRRLSGSSMGGRVSEHFRRSCPSKEDRTPLQSS